MEPQPAFPWLHRSWWPLRLVWPNILASTTITTPTASKFDLGVEGFPSHTSWWDMMRQLLRKKEMRHHFVLFPGWHLGYRCGYKTLWRRYGNQCPESADNINAFLQEHFPNCPTLECSDAIRDHIVAWISEWNKEWQPKSLLDLFEGFLASAQTCALSRHDSATAVTKAHPMGWSTQVAALPLLLFSDVHRIGRESFQHFQTPTN